MSTPELTLRPAAFIDRDGVINEERDYVHKPEDFALVRGAAEGLRALQEGGYSLVVVTNQAGIGRGMYTEADFHHLTEHMLGLLKAEGVSVAGVYFCPHHPTAGVGAYRTECDCRKPEPGMLRRAAHELGLDLSRSVMVGDKLSDAQAGRAAGVREAVLVRTGHDIPEAEARQARVFDDLPAAARHLLLLTELESA
jgi:D-glycero-D-manno-heptose 1,7-bisphosphate phosphatase